MSIKYTYKGNTTTVDADSITLTTKGKYLEDNVSIETEGGFFPSVFVTGLSETDTVSMTGEGQTYTPTWHAILPTGYTEVEYIESSGTQYIDTNIVPNKNYGFKATFMATSLSEDNGIAVAKNGSTSYRWGLMISSASWQVGYLCATKGSAYYINTGTASANNLYKVSYNYNSSLAYEVNDNTIESDIPYGDNDIGCNIYLFAMNSSGDAKYCSSIKLYKYELYNGDELVQNLIPCIRTSDSAVGMYDTVSGSFFGNSGTGSFTAGDTVDGWLFSKIKSLGTYTITATDGTKTTTETVEIDACIEYDLEMDYKLWLYKYGDECTAVTGGWTGGTKQTESMYTSSEIKTTSTDIDITGYTKFYVDAMLESPTKSSGRLNCTLYDTSGTYEGIEFVYQSDTDSCRKVCVVGTTRTVCYVDIRSIVASLGYEVYVDFISAYAKAYVYRAWLE